MKLRLLMFYNNAVTKEERNWEYARRKIGIDVRILAPKFESLVAGNPSQIVVKASN